MKRTAPLLLATALSAALAAAPAWSQGSGSAAPGPVQGATGAPAGSAPNPAARGSGGELARADRSFVSEAAMAGMAEVEAGRLAVQKASSPAVRQFAQKMVDDHAAANAELMKLAQTKGVAPPAELDRSHRRAVTALEKQSGADFDRAYMKMQVSDHEKTVSRFEKQAKSGQDAELRAWAQAKLPTLREHLRMARADGGDQARRDRSTPGAATTQGAATGTMSGSSAATTRPGGAATGGPAGPSATTGTAGGTAGSAPAGAAPGTGAAGSGAAGGGAGPASK